MLRWGATTNMLLCPVKWRAALRVVKEKPCQDDMLQHMTVLVDVQAALMIADQSLTPPNAYAIIASAPCLYLLAELQ